VNQRLGVPKEELKKREEGVGEDTTLIITTGGGEERTKRLNAKHYLGTACSEKGALGSMVEAGLPKRRRWTSGEEHLSTEARFTTTSR
jgi:hypothetical protein